MSVHGPLALEGAVALKISKRHFYQVMKNSLHGVTSMGLEPSQKFFQSFFLQILLLEAFEVFKY